MKTNIIKIGNSQGIILPSDLLHKLRLSLKSSVNIMVEEDKLVIKPVARQGWEEAAKLMARKGDDELLFPDAFNDENLSWWTWENKQ